MRDSSRKKPAGTHFGRSVGMCLAVAGVTMVGASEIRVDCQRRVGTIRPLHGVNGGVLNQGETIDLKDAWQEVSIPITRLHDCEWPNGDVIDMHAVFPDPRADPGDPGSYRFDRTDDYLRAIAGTGAEIVYRLGESIEHSRRKHHVHPPPDPERWADACVGIIRHYNEGWADGFRHEIRYWEIWNEPENRPAMWTGTDEDYYRLYVTAARKIRSRFPRVRVGGPSVGAPGDVVGGALRATPFLEGFLRRLEEASAPLDFFSWHTYSDDPEIYIKRAHAIRRWLDEHGFARTELHLNEWNYLPGGDWSPMLGMGLDRSEARREWFTRIGGMRGAAFVAYVLSSLQNAPVDQVQLYSGDTGSFGLFDRYGVPRKSFHALRAFKSLLRSSTRIAASGATRGETAVCAGLSDSPSALIVLLSNYRSPQDRYSLVAEGLPWTGPTVATVRVLDAKRNLEQLPANPVHGHPVRLDLEIPAPALVVVRFRPARVRAASGDG